MYTIGFLLEGRSFGLILALIATFSRNQILTATELVNPSVIGFYTGVLLLLFLWLWKKGPNKQVGLLFGIMFGLTVNTHYQAAGLFSLLLTLFLFGKKYFATFIQSMKGLFVTFLPLLFFEVTNQWFDTRHLVRYLLVDQYAIWTPMRWLTYVNDFWPRFIAFVLGGEKGFGLLVMLIIAFVFGVQILRGKLPSIYLLLVLNFAILVVIIRYYQGRVEVGYSRSGAPTSHG